MTKAKPEVIGQVVEGLKCWRCGRALVEAAGPGTRVRCFRCGAKTLVPGREVSTRKARGSGTGVLTA